MILIFSPGWAPFSPFLALPQLKGFLNNEGYDAEIVDENINFFDTILSSDYLKKNISEIKNRWEELNNLDKRDNEEQEEFIRLTKIILIENDIEKVDLIKNNYREGKDFSQEELDIIFGSASLIIEEKYKNFSVSSTGITNIKYNQDLISCIEDYTEDDENNLYYDYFLKDSKVLEKIQSHKDIGISVTGVTQLYSALTLAKLIRNKYGLSKRIFFGGNFITRIAMYYPNKLKLFFKFIDFISVGDGEYTLKSLFENNDLNKIPNAVFINDFGEIVFTEKKYFDLKKLVVPNFDGFELNKYFSSKLVLPVFASRSCYSNCSFCTIAKATSGPYRTYPIEEILEMISKLQIKYNCDFFTFVDETFNAKRLLEFSKKVIDRGLNFYWYTETRFDYYLTLEETNILYSAGCRKMQFGVESYNENILELMNKNITFSNIKSTIKNFIDVGIGVHLFFMIGFPGETKEEAKNSFRFMNEMVEYGNLKSQSILVTIGFGTFGLEIGSPVQNSPEKFKIKITTDFTQEDFIGLGLKYKVLGEFLSPEDADQIVKIKKEFGLSSFLSFDRRLFSENQNFLEISLPINPNKFISDSSNKIIKINNGLIEKDDCKYLLSNLLRQSFYLTDDIKLLEILDNNNYILIQDLIKNKKFKLNPFVEYEENNDKILLKNSLNGESFEVDIDTINEIFKFNIPQYINQKDYLDNLDFYNFILINNIIY